MATDDGSPILIASLEAMYALMRLGDELDALNNLGGRIDRDEYAQLAQLESQWCSTCQRIVRASFEAWKKNQPGEGDMPDDATRP